jgi:hypothetical protein
MRKRFTKPKTQEATKKTRDGREVCLNNTAGRKEYLKRKAEMYKRQNGMCCICGLPLPGIRESDFEHETPRGMGGGSRNDAIYDEQGNAINGLAHRKCNSQKGSRRVPIDHHPGGMPED